MDALAVRLPLAIEAIIFDFGQTLVDSADGFRSAEKAAERKLFADLALTDWEEFLANFRRVRTSFYTHGNFSRLGVWQEVYWHYCRDADETRLQQWETEYWQQVKDATTAFPEALPVLQELAGQYTLAVITNTEARTRTAPHRVHAFRELAQFFGTIVISGGDDIPPKPDLKAFTACLDEIDLAPASCVYVGDDWRMDVCGARDAGLQPIWLKHESVKRNWPDIDAGDVPVITNLNALLDLPALLANN